MNTGVSLHMREREAFQRLNIYTRYHLRVFSLAVFEVCEGTRAGTMPAGSDPRGSWNHVCF